MNFCSIRNIWIIMQNGEEGKAGVDRSSTVISTPKNSGLWWRENNPNGGRMLMFKPRDPK